MITGQCHCGAVRYEADGPVVKSSQCDCMGCQRATGSLKAPFVTVKRAGFRVVAGQAARYQAAGGERCDAHGAWHFCGTCGGPLFWLGHQGDEIDLFAGSLDDRAVFQAT